MFFDASHSLLACLGRPKIGLGASFVRPEAVPSASSCVPDTAMGAQDVPRSTSRQFWDHLAWIFVDFRLIFRNLFFKPTAMKSHDRKLEKESCDPHCLTWLLHCAVVTYCPCIFGNDRRMLYVQPFVVSYPQAHLVFSYIKNVILDFGTS